VPVAYEDEEAPSRFAVHELVNRRKLRCISLGVFRAVLHSRYSWVSTTSSNPKFSQSLL